MAVEKNDGDVEKRVAGNMDNKRTIKKEGARGKKWQRIISAGLIIYRKTNEGIKFLLLYRGRGVWDMSRGRMEADERSTQTAFREVYEETGLKKSDLRVDKSFQRVYEKFPYSRGGENLFKIVIFYLAETKKSHIKISEEHDGYGWFSLKEAQRHLGRYHKRKKLLQKAWEHVNNQ